MTKTVLTVLGIVGLAISSLGLAAAPATADKISLRVEIDGLAGLRVLTLRSDVEELGDRYAITVDYATSGVAGLIVNVRTHAEVRGRLGDKSAQPEWFSRVIQHSGVPRHTRVDYRADGAVESMSNPPLSDPVAASAMSGTVDNLTAYFLLERQLARTGSCALTVPVFDGVYRYNLFFTDVGRQKLAPAGGQRFEGTTTACHMRREMLAPLSGSELNQGAQRGTIWYARLIPTAGVMVPVRINMETQIGSVDGYLAEIHSRGVDLALMQ